MLFIGVFHGRSTNDNPIQKEKKVEFQEMKWNENRIESKEMRVRRTKSNIKIHSLTLRTNIPTDTHKQKLGLQSRCDSILFIFNSLSLRFSYVLPFHSNSNSNSKSKETYIF